MKSNAQRYREHTARTAAKRAANRANSPGLAFITLGAFMALAIYSLQYVEPASYSPDEVEAVNQLRAEATTHWKWKTRRAQEIASIWNLTPDEVGKPVHLWGAKDE